MFSIQRLFAKDDEFFALLRGSAAEGQASVRALQAILKDPQAPHDLSQFADGRRREKQITTQIAELLARTTITAPDREDIEAISHVLHKIPKTVEKFVARYNISVEMTRSVDFSRQVDLIAQAVDTVAEIIDELQKSNFEAVNKCNVRLQTIEGEADHLMPQLLSDLYSNKYPPLTVIIVKDLYELLERIVDRCRDAGNVVANVVLKSS